jgi:peptidoglycan hydrolase CwlO-like protein
MALELNNGDEDNALSEMTNQHGELQEEFDVLTEQVNKLVVENEKLQNTVKVLKDKVTLSEGTVEKLKGQKAQLLEEVENLVAARDEAFKSSEQAVVVTKADKVINEEKAYQQRNAFLTDEVMKFMPFSQK